MIVTFCGHSYSVLNDTQKQELKSILVKIMQNNPNCIFYLGGYGAFDHICLNILSQLKPNYPNVEILFVSPYLNDKYIKNKTNMMPYDGSIYPPIESSPLKFAILKRNEWMIKNSNLLICYVANKFGGAFNCYEYAIKQKTPIINIASIK